MKIAISNIAWDVSENEDVVRLMRQHGVRGLDVAPAKVSAAPFAMVDADLAAYRDFWAGYGVQLAGMQSVLYGQGHLKLFESEALRRETLAYLSAVMAWAGRLGVGPIVFGSPKNRQIGELEPDTAFGLAVELFGELGRIAHQHGVIFCIEPNPPQYGADFITTTSEAVRLVKAVGQPGLRINLDSAIMTMNGEEIEAALDSALPWLAHFHVSEPQLAVVRAGGVVDHARFAAHLRKMEYSGWLSIEMRSGWSQPDAHSVAAALAFVTEVYGETYD